MSQTTHIHVAELKEGRVPASEAPAQFSITIESSLRGRSTRPS